jgi:hypothetical protein
MQQPHNTEPIKLAAGDRIEICGSPINACLFTVLEALPYTTHPGPITKSKLLVSGKGGTGWIDIERRGNRAAWTTWGSEIKGPYGPLDI